MRVLLGQFEKSPIRKQLRELSNNLHNHCWKIMKQLLLISAISLAFALTTASASDLAIYSGPTNPDWISQNAANANTKAIMTDERIKSIFKNIENFGGGDEIGYNSPLGRWIKDHTGNGQQDVLISSSASTPSALYRFPNIDVDGSNIEKFIEDGNVYINVSDYIFFASWENARQNPWNREAGAANVFDIPWVHFWPPGGHGVPSIPMVPTEEGRKYLPSSLKEFGSDRPWHLDQFLGTDWETIAFAIGENNTSFADPAVVVNKKYGGIIASMWNKAQPNWVGTDPRGIGVIEFIANWLTDHGSITSPVNPEENPTTTWGDITHNRENAPNKVSLIYFLPNDRDPQPDINSKLNILIKNAQQFYASQMEFQGFGSKTFTFETNQSGNATVYYVYGRFTNAFYGNDTYNKIKEEILNQFDTTKHVYLVAADVSSELIELGNQSNVCGVAHSSWNSPDNQLWNRVTGGLVVMPASGRCFTPGIVGHELGHTFSLVHDYRDDTYLMGLGTQSRLSYCAAEWLSVHPFFTDKIRFNQNTTVEIRSQQDGRFQFQIMDPDGIHQAQFLIPAGDPSPVGTKLHGCESFNGKTNSTVTFVVNGFSPASDDTVTLQVMDIHGNISERRFPIQTVEDSNPTIVSIMPASMEAPLIGEQLVFTLHITNGVAVAGYQANLQFDNESLRYIMSEKGDYLPDGAFFAPSTVNRNTVQLLSTVLSGESDGNGTLATLTFEVITRKASKLVLSDVILSDKEGNTFTPELQNGEVVEPTRIVGDVNGDGVVNIADLVLVANSIGETGDTPADVNGDGVVNIADLVLVAGKIGTGGSAPSVLSEALQLFTADDIQNWITQARDLPLTDEISQKGILLLEQLLALSTPKETILMANYPNPFNPETWIPYQLVEPAKVTISIYSIDGKLVRILLLGHQPAGIYMSKSHAAYWDGKNEVGEPVASGVYFYTLTADDFTASRQMLIRK